ncbi:hypothetical protein KQH91_03370 [Lactobacillus johnsonii]|jgi:hypothetical protein|uniref:hypothetical protein n=1 Tax=Lactobacillus johnsonii TaxID=33959 RepID=UPI001C10E8AB|nr:hypothetical protein [Lactobacillus johnsonii]MBU5318559.1 hypothetical protein [Lactobacillus johnsonii]MDO5007278.1 hypothetical protein [Lactobacillus johnsonii]
MKNIIILNNEKELINQIQVLLEEDRKSLETINGIIAETKKKTVTLSSYSNTFKYFKKIVITFYGYSTKIINLGYK